MVMVREFSIYQKTESKKDKNERRHGKAREFKNILKLHRCHRRGRRANKRIVIVTIFLLAF